MKFWYLFSPLLTALNWIFEKLKLERVSIIAQLLSIYLIFLGIAEMRHRRKMRKKEKKHLLKSRAMRTTELSLDPEGQAVMLMQQIETYKRFGGKIMEKIKKTIQWLLGNKYSLATLTAEVFTSVMACVIVYAEQFYQAFDFLNNYRVVIQVATPIIAIIITALQLFILIKRCIDSNLSIQQYKDVKIRKKELNSLIEECKEKITNKRKEVDDTNLILEKLEVKVALMPNSLTAKQKEAYNKAYAIAPTLQEELEELELQLQLHIEELNSITI